MSLGFSLRAAKPSLVILPNISQSQRDWITILFHNSGSHLSCHNYEQKWWSSHALNRYILFLAINSPNLKLIIQSKKVLKVQWLYNLQFSSWWWWWLFSTATKGLPFEFILTYRRVLSIQTNPYQALNNKRTNYNKENCSTESESDQTGVQHIWNKIPSSLTFTFSNDSCYRPSSGGCHHTGKNHPPRTGSCCHPQTVLWKLKTPSLHNSSNPPGLHLPGCSPPCQLPRPGH